ncbi:glycosyltransferase 87 family protein [Actinoplanes sp. NPDC049596]|uniref:glycosyltransferase 87 family protein n=1 Tax=unclassified Actinoplanes TaxID=2626549 RepID=UPI00342FA49C
MTSLKPRTQVAIVAAATIAVGVFLVTVPTFRGFFDLGVYRGAVHYWLVDGGELYDYLYQGTEYGFTYPPFAALVLSPLALTSWPVAVACSLALNVTCVVLLLRWYLVPILRRHRLPLWTPAALVFLAVLVFEPARDTFSFGQVNLALLVLVGSDRRRSPWRGLGIGLASAIKLTPAVFIGYLILTRQYRAAAVASGTAAGASLLAFLVAPGTSRRFWTETLWDTGRVGKLEYVSNQSLRGVVARLDASAVWWLLAVAVILAIWWLGVRRVRDDTTGFALTGIVACLISPVTWVHHLVWLLPALFLLAGRASRHQWPVLGAVYVVLSSSVVWLWWAGAHGLLAAIGSNTYVWISIGLLLALEPPGRATYPPWRRPPYGREARSDLDLRERP